LVTGATGYIGGRLVPRLLELDHEVRCLSRDPDKLADVPWVDSVEIARGDVLDPDSLSPALEGIDVVYYLVHSLASQDFAERDRRAATCLGEAARDAGVQRIVYLGGLVPEGATSEHLGSRAEVGDILLRSGVPTVVLQAGVIIGSGSVSFEMVRYLTENLPVMVTPKWVRNRIQPIAVRDVLHYLTGALDIAPAVNRAFDIGGPQVLTYAEMMQRYAAVAGLPRRRIFGVPVLTPRLSSYWINLVTPVPKAVAAPLIESLAHEVVCREHDIDEHVPPPAGGTTGYDQAVRLALQRLKDAQVDTRWSTAEVARAPAEPLPSDPQWSGGSVYLDLRARRTGTDPHALWRVIEGIGGERGWYSFPLAWSARGYVDRLIGGVGHRRGRRDPDRLRSGEALDWWRVERLERGRLLLLRAEMRLPGRAWLELRVEPEESGRGAIYCQRAVFVPRGLAGHAYWWAISPFHSAVFGGMARNIVRAARRGNLLAPVNSVTW
jgi:uncharacterized protein YbjT (DUF2867 family)